MSSMRSSATKFKINDRFNSTAFQAEVPEKDKYVVQPRRSIDRFNMKPDDDDVDDEMTLIIREIRQIEKPLSEKSAVLKS